VDQFPKVTAGKVGDVEVAKVCWATLRVAQRNALEAMPTYLVHSAVGEDGTVKIVPNRRST
jgi:hypothetical protein